MSLMLVNPRKRKARRTAAQKRATAKMLAANRTRRRPGTKRHSSARRSNPVGLSRVVHRRRHHTAHRRRARRRNPISLSGGSIGSLLMNGLKGAGGAVAVNVVANYLPATFTNGKILYVSRAALAILMGTMGRKMLGNNARIMAEGAMVVNIHDFINNLAGAMLPGGQMHGMDAYLNGAIPNQLPNNASGNVVDTELSGMGEYIYR